MTAWALMTIDTAKVVAAQYGCGYSDFRVASTAIGGR
jgi:hypothetical protein